MVGIPRSKGCQTCIQRRTKCDEARPACGNCLKYGAVCPGYDRGLKFVAGKHPVRSRGRQLARGGRQGGGGSARAVVPNAGCVSRSRPRPGSKAASPAGQNSAADEDATMCQDALVPRRRVLTSYERFQLALGELSLPFAAPRANTAQFISTLIYTVQSTPQQKSELASFGILYENVLNRVGSNPTLDSAICSFTLHLLGKQNHDEQIVGQSRMLYGQSLGALQRALEHPIDWRASETICAATILCLFEVSHGSNAK
jgi:hypothetical protein